MTMSDEGTSEELSPELVAAASARLDGERHRLESEIRASRKKRHQEYARGLLRGWDLARVVLGAAPTGNVADATGRQDWRQPLHGRPVQPERWSQHVRAVVLGEVASFVNVVVTRLLPTFAKVDDEVSERAELMFRRAMQETSLDPDNVPDPGDLAAWAQDSALDWGFGVHQAFWSSKALFAAGLYHLFEQQAVSFIWLSREMTFAKDVNARFQEWLGCAGIDTDSLTDWGKVTEELRHVANVTKHAEGSSAKALRNLRPEFFNLPGIGGSPGWARRPLAADGLYIPDAEFSAYGEAIQRLWTEVAEHFERQGPDQRYVVR